MAATLDYFADISDLFLSGWFDDNAVFTTAAAIRGDRACQWQWLLSLVLALAPHHLTQ
jgi:hypothetical protein